MPWTTDDAVRHTKLATTTHLKEMWRDIANNVLQQDGDEGKAIRVANGRLRQYVEKHGKRKKPLAASVAAMIKVHADMMAAEPPLELPSTPDFTNTPKFDEVRLHPTTMRCILEMAMHPDIDLDDLAEHIEQIQQLEGEGSILTMQLLGKHMPEEMQPEMMK